MTKPIRLRYQTIEFDGIDIHICTLRDRQQFHDPDDTALDLGISSAMWPIFGVIWPSSIVLANYMSNYDFKGKRILEIGCGMALSSLLLNAKNADITATDHHPEVAKFLLRNTKLNTGKDIAYECVDWSNELDSLGKFDLIIGSDLLYEDQHVLLTSNFIHRHANESCQVVLVDPGRGRANKLISAMSQLGFTYTEEFPAAATNMDKPFKGKILTFLRKG